jgi:hypothetical protein
MAWALFNERLAVGAIICMVFCVSGELANRQQIGLFLAA